MSFGTRRVGTRGVGRNEGTGGGDRGKGSERDVGQEVMHRGEGK